VSRFRQAISEGDGISVVPVLLGDVEDLAALAEEAGAEAVAVEPADVGRVRTSTSLAVLARGGDPGEALASGADAWIVPFAEDAEDLVLRARELDLDCAVEVRDEESLEEALERIDPDIILISERGLDEDEEDLERTLDLLADVPAGKLVISEARVIAREQVVALENAGVDAILVGVEFLTASPDFASALAELTGR
jgi:putative N-acetylmannosamine-6-phosphate epimerase